MALIGLGAGCLAKKGSVDVAAQQEPPAPRILTLESADDLKLDALPYIQGQLILAGTVIPIELQLKRKGSEIHYLLLASGQQIEEEIYELGPSELLLRNASGESFTPPIPILRFPMSAGRSWDWSGKMASGPTPPRQASAQVTSEGVTLNVPGGPYSSVLVRVKLEIESGGPSAAERHLSFWFAQRAGLVKREFGSSSTREPVAE